MKIQYEMNGGFASVPALNKAVTIDTNQINPLDASQILSLINASRFFDLPSHINTLKKGAADYRIYKITIEDSPRSHSIQLTDPITDANLQQLVSRLQSLGRSL